jgi:hypothetical protein
MNGFKKRVERLEKDIRDQSITARDEDGEQIRLRRHSLLPLTVAAFRRRYAQIEGLPAPISPLDARLDHLKRVGVSYTSEPLIGLACDVLRRTGQERLEQ